ncbi:MAG: MqnA/MqnD/SBP family protein [Phycisphaerae bacterium]
MANKEILLGHSPDADDAFMFYALAREKISTGPYRIKHIMEDIQTLNERAIRNELDITAISIHAYAYVKSHYLLLTSGASMGLNYGPVVVSKTPMTIEDLSDKKIAIPGIMTTAFLVLRLAVGDFNYEAVPFDKILFQVGMGQADAGLIIHEGQMNYSELGFHKVVDLGEWWHEQTGLPLPLGGNAIKRSLGPNVIDDLAGIIRQSIQYGFDHFDEAVDYAMPFARKMSREHVEAFVRMYVNQWTLDCGQDGKQAIHELLARAETGRLIPHTLPVEFI